MKIVIFGLSISSSWGNGHATLWRALCRSLLARGHSIVFFERDVTYYAAHRDFQGLAGMELVLYENWPEVEARARDHFRTAEVGIITSYCPDALVAGRLLLSFGRVLRVFYDMDSPVTLAQIKTSNRPEYVGDQGYSEFDLVLSYAGGEALHELREHLGATRVAPLYGSVDPERYRPEKPSAHYSADMSYLGTYAEDRRKALEDLFVCPARQMPTRRFIIGGAQYPTDFPWTENTHFVKHLSPAQHPSLYSSSRLTLNVTRKAMAKSGFCPSGRLFEAAACGVPIITDDWDGLALFFEPCQEILVARSSQDVVAAIEMPNDELQRIARAARERCLEFHTAEKRTVELEALLEWASQARVSRESAVSPPARNYC